jgi:hypothetical protein
LKDLVGCDDFLTPFVGWRWAKDFSAKGALLAGGVFILALILMEMREEERVEKER